MKAIMPRQEAYDKFIDLRAKVHKSLEGRGANSFARVFQGIKNDAKAGDAVAQDVLAYFYKDGIEYNLREDYRKYLFWEFLAGANGNEFAIEKLQFFFSYAYDTIVDNEDFGYIKYLNDIDEFNYIGIIGQYICDELVSAFNIDEKSLADEEDNGSRFSPALFNEVRKKIDEITPKVIERMKSKGSAK